MWQRIGTIGHPKQDPRSRGPMESDTSDQRPDRRSRRAYYRVSGSLPIRVNRLSPDSGEAPESDDVGSSLELRLRRIEAKLDLLLSGSSRGIARPLSDRDRRSVVFSGAGLALDVDFPFARGEAFEVELLLPSPTPRLVRAVGEAVEGADDRGPAERSHRLALRFVRIPPADRDALVACSYELQRASLRARHRGGPSPS